MHDFQLLTIGQDVKGEETLRPLAEAYQLRLPVLVDKRSELGTALGFKITPSGLFVGPDGRIVYKNGTVDFDINQPETRLKIEQFLNGEPVEPAGDEASMSPEAFELFKQGVSLMEDDRKQEAVERWRRALEHDPDNFIIRSQIWAVNHPERFYPEVDRQWQKQKLKQEGYDKPLP